MNIRYRKNLSWGVSSFAPTQLKQIYLPCLQLENQSFGILYTPLGLHKIRDLLNSSFYNNVVVIMILLPDAYPAYLMLLYPPKDDGRRRGSGSAA